jgi:hypothetical protein
MKKRGISALMVLALLGLTAAYFQPTVQSQSGLPMIEMISVGTDGIAG